jgi:ABC-type transport system substrate-binding protein
MLGVLIAAAGCATSTAAPPPTQTSTPAAVTPDQLALATLNSIVQGDPAAATVNFDSTMRRLLPPDTLQQAWAAYQQKLGPYLSQGDPQDVARGKLTVVNVPLQMQNAPGLFRLTVRSEGQIAGLYFLKDGAPVP